VQNIHSLVSVTLDLSSTNYDRWHGNVWLTLGRYSLFDHVLLDTTYVGVLAWDRMDNVIKSWIWCTITTGNREMFIGQKLTNICL
jgi:hypothetical protein